MGVSFAAPVSWQFAASAIVGAVLLGGALLLASEHEREATTSAQGLPMPAVATDSAALTPAPKVESQAALVRPAIVSAEPAPRRVSLAEDPLAQEVALLSQATRDLHAGRASDALKALDEHQRRFPNGILNEERCAARAQALCALGRQREARTELARLPPQSLAVAHAKQVCEEP